MQILPGCSSFHNFSHAALAWVALTQTLGRDLEIKDVFWCGFVTILAASVNVARLSTIALWPEYFETIHGPLGNEIAGTLAILLIAFVCIGGQRRELFARA
jgi:exosortase/archaeosortase family protein